MATDPPVCRKTRQWLKSRGMSTAALTGQDARALSAFVHLCELYSIADTRGQSHALSAMISACLAMQSITRYLAKACIPMVLDYGDEERVWKKLSISLPDVVTPHTTRRSRTTRTNMVTP